jgi:hypothetical protein
MADRDDSDGAVRVVNHVLILAIAVLTLVAVNTASTLEAAGGSVVDTPLRWGQETPAGTTASPITWPTEAEEAASDSRAAARGAVALAEISYPWRDRLPGWEIAFHDAEDGAYGYTLTKQHRIDIYVRDDQSDALLAHVVAHEIGHAVDVTFNDGDDRDRWQGARGIEDEPWWPDNRASDFATGAGDFAECFAAWQVGPDDFRSRLGDPPTEAQQHLLAELATE